MLKLIRWWLAGTMTKDSSAGFVGSVIIQTKRRTSCFATWTWSTTTLATAVRPVGRLPRRRMRCSFIKENTTNRVWLVRMPLSFEWKQVVLLQSQAQKKIWAVNWTRPGPDLTWTFTDLTLTASPLSSPVWSPLWSPPPSPSPTPP